MYNQTKDQKVKEKALPQNYSISQSPTKYNGTSSLAITS